VARRVVAPLGGWGEGAAAVVVVVAVVVAVMVAVVAVVVVVVVVGSDNTSGELSGTVCREQSKGWFGQGWFCKFKILVIIRLCWPLWWPDSGRSWRIR